MHLDLILNDARHYRFYAQVKCNAHFKMCRIYHRRHNWIGIPAVIVGTIVGTTIFSGLVKNADYPWAQIVTGVLAIAAVVLSSLQTFFNFPAMSAHHKDAAVKYEAVRHELDNLIRTLVISPPREEAITGVLKSLHDITARMNQVSQEAPSLRSGVYDRAKQALKDDPLLEVSGATLRPVGTRNTASQASDRTDAGSEPGTVKVVSGSASAAA